MVAARVPSAKPRPIRRDEDRRRTRSLPSGADLPCPRLEAVGLALPPEAAQYDGIGVERQEERRVRRPSRVS